MAVILHVPAGVVHKAKAQWDEAADELDGNWRRLHKASTAGFSNDVVAAIEAFREPWVDEIKAASQQAQEYAESVTFFGGLVVVADTAQAEELRALLPWVHRAAEITGG